MTPAGFAASWLRKHFGSQGVGPFSVFKLRLPKGLETTRRIGFFLKRLAAAVKVRKADNGPHTHSKCQRKLCLSSSAWSCHEISAGGHFSSSTLGSKRKKTRSFSAAAIDFNLSQIASSKRRATIVHKPATIRLKAHKALCPGKSSDLSLPECHWVGVSYLGQHICRNEIGDAGSTS